MAMESYNILDNVDFTIAQAIQNGIAVAASDGCYDEATGVATSSYQLCAATLWNCNSMTSSLVLTNPLEKQRINPYRSELAGILGVLIIVQCLCTFHGLKELGYFHKRDFLVKKKNCRLLWEILPSKVATLGFDVKFDGVIATAN